MWNMADSLLSMRHLDDLARRQTSIHRLHPVAKLVTTVMYLAVVTSFDSRAIGALLPLALFPVVLMALAELPPDAIVKRLLFVEAFVVTIGILSPLLNREVVTVGGMTLSAGWLVFVSLLLKSALTVTATLILIATTGMDRIAVALRLLKAPKLFVLQLMLTYRYISVLMEEVQRTVMAYSLRAPEQRGVHWTAWGSLAGQLLLRTVDRAQRVYEAMRLRGFDGDFQAGEAAMKVKASDYGFTAGWVAFFLAARFVNLSAWLGSLITGVLR
ncbi:cobalt ECF transporter T component CbiQ [Heliobacterium gestii]|uniref:Cobalt ECF transporter T component CbiQ n=1 Tax=Heliomicrobium gestii TaxID=2699 RepID=A0A845LCT7_HELGE|nr:cobalt ECF transporter T component CbiQ [Heliomicrobium gestii]MBM7867614.1 cobalt/nickel transport system permease protein [Heliomicrobium gestii]MZP44008.1 cobalt ECF transporter T component CbiQ [Heliomicrobium gestii]